MKSLMDDLALREIAKRVIWFEPPTQALSDPTRFVAYAMAHATFADMQRIRHHFTDDDLRDILDNAPPGIIDPRSWAYWHAILGQYPAPPMPQRTL